MHLLKTSALTLALLAAGMSAVASAQDTPPDPAMEAIKSDQAQKAADATMGDEPPPPSNAVDAGAAPPPPPMDGAMPPPPPPAPPVDDAAAPPAPPPPPPARDGMAPPPPGAAMAAPPPPPTGVATAAGPTTVRSNLPDSVMGEYKIDFQAMDRDRNGAISRSEATSNATLTAEFRAVDDNGDGRLSKQELAGWM